MKKIKCIVKRPDEVYGHVCNVSNRLENLQKTVEGYIEVIPVGEGALMICNEEGKLRGLPHNMFFSGDSIRGTIIICGQDGEEFGDIPISLARWKEIVDEN